MHIREAIMLVRKKYLEEQKGKVRGRTAEHYQNACDEFPASMAVAHHIWVQEVGKPS